MTRDNSITSSHRWRPHQWADVKAGDLVKFKRLIYDLGVGMVIETPHSAATAVKVLFPSKGVKPFHRSLIEVIDD